jgi:hypothetical protein
MILGSGLELYLAMWIIVPREQYGGSDESSADIMLR